MMTPSDVGLSDIEIQTWLSDKLNSYMLAYFVDGFYTGLYGMAIWQLLAVKKISRARIYMGCIITALYITSTIHAIVTCIKFSRVYVFATSFRVRYSLMFLSVLWEILGATTTGLSLIIADCTIIWRCWVVWTHDWKVIILPISFVVAGIVCGVNAVVHEMVSSDDETKTKWVVATIALTFGTKILCTALIAGRIIYVARGHGSIMGGIRTYRDVLEILVESAALYSITFVIFIVLYALGGNGYMYPQALFFPVTGIPPMLNILRVASGQGRPEESSQETQSSLHFQTSRGSTIETTTDGAEGDTMQENVGGTTLVMSGSIDQV